MTFKIIFTMLIGLACGIGVGTGFVAFITVLGIIPRLMQLTKTAQMIVFYEMATVLGVVAGSLLGLWEPVFPLHRYVLFVFGSFYGVFVGMFAAALTEVLNVFPIIAKRIQMEDRLLYLLMAMVTGKIFGSLFQWLYFVNK